MPVLSLSTFCLMVSISVNPSLPIEAEKANGEQNRPNVIKVPRNEDPLGAEPNSRLPSLSAPFVASSLSGQVRKDSHTPITLKLELSKAPKLNEKVTIRCIVQSHVDAPGTVAEIGLPQSAKKISGNVSWIGKLEKGVPLTFTAVIKFVAEGNWVISARAIRKIDENNSWGDMDSIYINVTKKAGKFGFASSSPKNSAQSKKP
ncbi:MAG TPA: hypothetical protein VJU86_04345 [Pyrinomonadaceae bacterium]|nr:hypothetical protein [Pyrinomonadaceae bacterium]